MKNQQFLLNKCILQDNPMLMLMKSFLLKGIQLFQDIQYIMKHLIILVSQTMFLKDINHIKFSKRSILYMFLQDISKEQQFSQIGKNILEGRFHSLPQLFNQKMFLEDKALLLRYHNLLQSNLLMLVLGLQISLDNNDQEDKGILKVTLFLLDNKTLQCNPKQLLSQYYQRSEYKLLPNNKFQPHNTQEYKRDQSLYTQFMRLLY